MKKQFFRWAIGCGALLVAFGVAAGLLGLWGDAEAARKRIVYDEEFRQTITESSELTTDRERMWHTVPGVGNPASEFEVSPVSAINAASRVFASVDLRGKPVEELALLLGVRPRPKYGYAFPFQPTKSGNLMYRFDCGSFGWQFNIVLDAEGKVLEVQRYGIE